MHDVVQGQRLDCSIRFHGPGTRTCVKSGLDLPVGKGHPRGRFNFLQITTNVTRHAGKM